VTNSNGTTVNRIAASTGIVTGTYPVGSQPLGICFDGANIWVANSGGTTVSKL
jgi:DNA-binding beta-propeller fold protein YncE